MIGHWPIAGAPVGASESELQTGKKPPRKRRSTAMADQEQAPEAR